MSDISKCHGDNCEKRDTCYRFTAKADPMWQAYLEPDRNGQECNRFWPIDHTARTAAKPSNPNPPIPPLKEK